MHHRVDEHESGGHGVAGILQLGDSAGGKVPAGARPAEQHRVAREAEKLLCVLDRVAQRGAHLVGRLGEVRLAEALDVVDRQDRDATRGEFERDPVGLGHVQVPADERTTVHPYEGATGCRCCCIPIQPRRDEPAVRSVDEDVGGLDVLQVREAALQRRGVDVIARVGWLTVLGEPADRVRDRHAAEVGRLDLGARRGVTGFGECHRIRIRAVRLSESG
jgi:hypothetical protein